MQNNNHLRFLPAFVSLHQAQQIIDSGCAERVSYTNFCPVQQLEMNRGKKVETIKEIPVVLNKEFIPYSEMDCVQQLAFNRQ